MTNDKWIRERGKLDPTDDEILEKVAKGGKVVVMTLGQALEAMQAEEPEKFQAFKKQIGIPLTIADIVKLSTKADKRMTAFDTEFASGMKKEHAELIRVWRVDEHYSWRAVARAAYMKVRKELGWRHFKQWAPPSNQLAGMSLCNVAAKMLGEDYTKEPWN